MASHPRAPGRRGVRRGRQLRPCLINLEQRVVPSIPGIVGITFDSSGDVCTSYDSTPAFSTQQESIAEFDSSGNLINTSEIGTAGASALPGALATVVSSLSLPSVSTGDILEL